MPLLTEKAKQAAIFCRRINESNGKTGLPELREIYQGSIFEWTSEDGLVVFWIPSSGKIPTAIKFSAGYIEQLGPAGRVVKDRNGTGRRLSEKMIPTYAAMIRVMDS